MPKRAPAIATPVIELAAGGSVPLYRQLYERLRERIVTGQLEPGTRLPSTRALASTLGISRNTTALAYELLLLEGYLESRVGDGTRVGQLQPHGQASRQPTQPPDSADLPCHPSASRSTELQARRSTLPMGAPLSRRGQLLADFADSPDVFADPTEAGRRLFRVGEPDVSAFPFATWTRLLAKHARSTLPSVAHYSSAQGCAALRAAIAGHIGITRGVRCAPEEIILTSGSQGALDLVARVLLDPGDRVWVEDPGYWGTQGALLSAGAQLVAVPVDDAGIDVAAGRDLSPHARLVVVTPSHQFPTAVTMPLGRRLELLEWGRREGAWIVEDDYDSEYRYSGRPLEALQGLDTAGRVIYVGTFSKVLFPALRIGYLVIPPNLVDGMLAARRLIDVHQPPLEQWALADFLAEGHYTRHLRRMRQRYLERRNILVDALRSELSDIVDVVVPEAGLHLVAKLRSGVSGQMVAAIALERGLSLQVVPQGRIRPSARDRLMLGFAHGTAEELRGGVRTLASILRA